MTTVAEKTCQRQEKPLTHEWREANLKDHPVATKQYLLVTRTVEACTAIARERFAFSQTGTVFFGPPRLGKTRCSMVIRASIEEEFEDALVILFSADTGSTSRDTGLFADLLDADGVLPASKRTAKQNFRHLLTHIPIELARYDGHRFLLLIDELQLLTESELRQLLVLHNRLEQRRVTMTTIGFAQPEVLHLREGLLASRSLNLIARFLAEPIEFEGCTCEDDLAVILDEYDCKKTFPYSSDITFTQFFYPLAYARGFRLKNYTRRLFAALAEAATNLGIGSVPMQHVSTTIEMLLIENRSKDAAVLELEDSMIEGAVDRSNLRLFASVLGPGLRKQKPTADNKSAA